MLGYGPLKAGLAFLPFTAGIVIGVGLAQQLIQGLGARAVLLIGLALAIVGMVLFTRITVDGTYLGQLLPAIGVTSIGMGLTFVPITLLATTNVAGEDAGLASGLFNTSQQVGGALGLAVLSTIAASRTRHLPAIDHSAALVSGFRYAFATGAALMLAAVLLLAAMIRDRHVARINAEEPASVTV